VVALFNLELNFPNAHQGGWIPDEWLDRGGAFMDGVLALDTST
jgi:hypothetical protein